MYKGKCLVKTSKEGSRWFDFDSKPSKKAVGIACYISALRNLKLLEKSLKN
jgi:hypothetical protein